MAGVKTTNTETTTKKLSTPPTWRMAVQTARKAASTAGPSDSAGVARGSESGALTGGMPGRPAPLEANRTTCGQ